MSLLALWACEYWSILMGLTPFVLSLHISTPSPFLPHPHLFQSLFVILGNLHSFTAWSVVGICIVIVWDFPFIVIASPFCGAGWLPAGLGRWTCSVCRDSVAHLSSHLKHHISTAGHKWLSEYTTCAQMTIFWTMIGCVCKLHMLLVQSLILTSPLTLRRYQVQLSFLYIHDCNLYLCWAYVLSILCRVRCPQILNTIDLSADVCCH